MSDELRVVKVVWIDPHSIDEWCDTEELVDSEICQIVSVGIFVKETPDKIVLTLNYSPSGNEGSCSMILPKKCIVHMSEVAFVKKILD
jgi:hypothetical protein